ncbi:MAG: citramalate synthase [Ardenticatenaceae bacterium]|nr:citramalate synthase [Anaerolineales bacterium]MCB8921526.1 citramalate synthase [Ardenticatenaceae bacterium]MCB8990932.1 citramalate synthase [Ardenticatenaceae bacterium]
MSDNTVFVYDTTLRDGTQREGLNLSLNDKLKIARQLDEFGAHYIEGGWPGSNPKDADFFRAVQDMTFRHAKVAAFGSTRRKHADTANDPNIRALMEAQTPVVTLVGKSWDLHVRDVLETDLEENLAMISDSVAYFKTQEKEVIYDAEHFFDGYKANPEYALLTVQVAAQAGADCVVLCDTNGGSLPWEVSQIVREVKEKVGDTAVGIHTHDDGGCAVANTLAAVDSGAVHVQGTINGYGERVGNANLCTTVPDLQLKMGKQCVPPESLQQVSELAHYVAEISNLPHDTHAPYVGSSAFAHKGGIHVAAMRKNVLSYQHIDPTLVGNEQRTIISELSGRGNVFDKAAEFGVDVDSDEARAILQQIKELENEGFAFEAGEASMSLLLRRMKKGYRRPFEMLDFTTWISVRDGVPMVSDASVKIRIDGEVIHTASEGNGPVNALSLALRKALFTKYPQLQTIHLMDYKVRILDGENGTGARVRVLIDFMDGDRRWSTVGASTNIIEASWHALVDSYEYALLNGSK